MVVGASDSINNEIKSGSTYVFKKDEQGIFTELTEIIPENGSANDFFGASVAVLNGYIVIGAHGDDDIANNSGSAYVYKNDDTDKFSLITKLSVSNSEGDEYFGNSVSLSDEYIVVGAYKNSQNGSYAGASYIFKNNGNDVYSIISRLIPSDGNAYDYFGDSVSISGDYVVVGASEDDDLGDYSGSAYMFNINSEDKPYILNFNQNLIVVENTDVVATYISGLENTYSLSGEDYLLFSINENGILTFNNDSLPSYENPGDYDSNNVYKINITVTNTENKSNTYSLSITVTLDETSEGESGSITDG